MDGSLAVSDLNDASGVTTRRASDRGLDAMQRQICSLRGVLEPEGQRDGARLVRSHGSQRETRYTLRPTTDRSFWVVIGASEYQDRYGQRESADTPPVVELEHVRERLATGEAVMQHVALEAARGPALVASIGHVGRLEDSGFAGDEVAIAAQIENHGLRRLEVQQLLVMLRPPGQWAGRLIQDGELPAT